MVLKLSQSGLVVPKCDVYPISGNLIPANMMIHAGDGLYYRITRMGAFRECKPPSCPYNQHFKIFSQSVDVSLFRSDGISTVLV